MPACSAGMTCSPRTSGVWPKWTVMALGTTIGGFSASRRVIHSRTRGSSIESMPMLAMAYGRPSASVRMNGTPDCTM